MWVIKVGGSLLESRKPSLLNLVRTLVRLRKKTPLVVLTGGGSYADCVRALDRKHSLGSGASHWTAVLAMHLNAYRLARFSREAFSLTTRPAQSPPSKIALFLPLDLLRRADLPKTWDVTSDSIAAFLASRLNARLLLAKTVDGVIDPFPGGKLLREVSADDLLRLQSSPVDAYLPLFLSAHRMDAWLANGLFPERLESIVKGQDTVASHILPRTRR